jgi:hypothetical protein
VSAVTRNSGTLTLKNAAVSLKSCACSAFLSIVTNSLPRVGILARLELREADGGRVGDCSAYLTRRSLSGNRYAYSVTDSDPVMIELGIDEWGGQLGELRQFVLETVSAFPELIRNGAKQFGQMRFSKRRR